MRVPIREAAFVGLLQAVRAGFPDLAAEQIQRNAASDIDASEALPLLRLFDGDQRPGDTSSAPEQAYRVDWSVQGWVEADDDAGLGVALNLLHARLIEAVVPWDGLKVPLAGGQVLELWLDEGAMTVDLLGVEVSERPAASFLQEFTFELRANRGSPFVELPD